MLCSDALWQQTHVTHCNANVGVPQNSLDIGKWHVLRRHNGTTRVPKIMKPPRLKARAFEQCFEALGNPVRIERSALGRREDKI